LQYFFQIFFREKSRFFPEKTAFFEIKTDVLQIFLPSLRPRFPFTCGLPDPALQNVVPPAVVNLFFPCAFYFETQFFPLPAFFSGGALCRERKNRRNRAFSY
jgi:hypothetical protein